MFRILQEPQRLLIQAYLELGGEKWQDEQLKQAIAGEGRSFAALVAASLEHELKFFSLAKDYMSKPALWELLHPSQRVAHLRGLAFRGLSCAGACVYQFMVVPRQQFPYTLLRCMEEPAAAVEVLGSPPCLRDPWSATFLAAFPDPRSPEAQLEMGIVLEALLECISGIEARHAAVRLLCLHLGVGLTTAGLGH